MLRIDDMQKAVLVLTAWRYAKIYGQQGHLTAELIMGCIANRVKAGHGTWLEVIERIPLYAAENEIPAGFPQVWDPAFMKLLHSVEGLYDGSVPNPAKEGKYWADLRHVETDFFKEKILGNSDEHPRIVDMNSFSVFR